jgi:hypothetical protein
MKIYIVLKGALLRLGRLAELACAGSEWTSWSEEASTWRGR